MHLEKSSRSITKKRAVGYCSVVEPGEITGPVSIAFSVP
jgi:hypothetical protein